MADISEIYINYDNVPTTPMRRSWTNTGTFVVPRNDSRNGITIQNDISSASVITYQYTGGPNTNPTFDLSPGGGVENSRVKGNNSILAITIVAGADTVNVEEW